MPLVKTMVLVPGLKVPPSLTQLRLSPVRVSSPPAEAFRTLPLSRVMDLQEARAGISRLWVTVAASGMVMAVLSEGAPVGVQLVAVTQDELVEPFQVNAWSISSSNAISFCPKREEKTPTFTLEMAREFSAVSMAARPYSTWRSINEKYTQSTSLLSSFPFSSESR